MQRLHTDQGRNFESAVFKKITDILGIKKTRTTPYHPQCDGVVERMNRTLKDILSKLVNERQALLAYRSTVQTSTGFSPHFLMFGRETKIPVDLMTPDPPQAEVPHQRRLNSLPDRPPNETKLQSKEIPETRKENAENCSGQTSRTEAITYGENDEDEWTVGYFRQNVRQIRPSRTINVDEHGQNLPDEVQEDVQHLPDELQEDVPSRSMEQNNPRNGSDGTLQEPVEGNEGQSQAPPERPARTRKNPAWLRDYE
ncbi:Retrovirus-related Pol poly from transposon [Paramuricea clavata]|uniref:Retrovirus-related Pol poly from transposon n=1 Tax=Paramuricea clavata TaxID=317549 RepID=A0A7D9L8Q3_PARCT|nr:Retrovirus-related Pol poly from transposon [Paramuricea clavata]